MSETPSLCLTTTAEETILQRSVTSDEAHFELTGNVTGQERIPKTLIKIGQTLKVKFLS